MLRADGAHPRISRLALHRRTLAQREEANGPGTTLLALPTSLHLIRESGAMGGRRRQTLLASHVATRSGDARVGRREIAIALMTTETPTSLRSLSTSTDEPSQPLIVLVLAKDVLGRVHLEIQKNHLLLVVLLQTVVIIALRVGVRVSLSDLRLEEWRSRRRVASTLRVSSMEV